jgi:hypothetical protein
MAFYVVKGIDRRDLAETPWILENNGRTIVSKTAPRRDDEPTGYRNGGYSVSTPSGSSWTCELSAGKTRGSHAHRRIA